ncbi:MBL fold metallo-hydrolase [Paenibacillus chartarius]|uniref:MBL fold metallo-hydrolase n=1 Tax=Paenibacillus chartarius TaxID=747481 RepID=A0ABV6DQJ8_9BACL
MASIPAYRSGASLLNQMAATAVPVGAVAVWHLGQESVVLKGGGMTIYIDPYLSDSVNEVTNGQSPRKFASPLQPHEVTNADAVFITHDHLDHLDPWTLKDLAAASPQAAFVCPVHCIPMLTDIGIARERIHGVNAGQTHRVGALQFTPVAAKHEEFTVDADGNHAFLGYVFRLNGVTVYHAGDTIGFRELAEELEKQDIDIAMLPINGRDFARFAKGLVGNMDFREAVELGRHIGADLLVPLHYDLFEKNTENPAYFVDYIQRYYPQQKFKMLVPGERMLYLSERDE